MPSLLTVAVICFAYSTVVSWCYYGECGTEYLFGRKGVPVYRAIYVVVATLGPVLSLGHVIEFSDLMLLSMAFPNIMGMIILSSKAKSQLHAYFNDIRSGVMVPSSIHKE